MPNAVPYTTEYTSIDLALMHYIPPVRMIKIRGHILHKTTRYPTYVRGMYKESEDRQEKP